MEELHEVRRKRNACDIPARVGLQLLGWKDKRPIAQAMEYYMIDFEFSQRPEMVSFNQLSGRGEDFFVSDQRGLWSMYEGLYKPVTDRILLGKTVTEIMRSLESVEIYTSDGEKYVSDYALCTFSTGVLGSDLVTFNPPLPQWKKEANHKNPLAVYMKIFLKFPRKFWDDNEYILHASKLRGRFPVLQDLDRPGILPKGSGILLITVTEDEGKRIEEQTDNETQVEVMKTLRKIYGQGIPDPIGKQSFAPK